MIVICVLGLVVAVLNIYFTTASKCDKSDLGKLATLNIFVCLGLLGFTLLLVHIFFLIPFCCKKSAEKAPDDGKIN